MASLFFYLSSFLPVVFDSAFAPAADAFPRRFEDMTWPRRLLVSSAAKAGNFRGQKGSPAAYRRSRSPRLHCISAWSEPPFGSTNLNCWARIRSLNNGMGKLLDGNFRFVDHPPGSAGMAATLQNRRARGNHSLLEGKLTAGKEKPIQCSLTKLVGQTWAGRSVTIRAKSRPGSRLSARSECRLVSCLLH
jgi:hypothetical protein